MEQGRHRYFAFGLTLASDLRLPEFTEALHIGDAEVDIRAGAVPSSGAEIGARIGPFVCATKNMLWLRVPGVARFLVRDGREITYAVEATADESSLRVFMLGSCIGALLLQRGQLVLHGNAFEVADGCVICVGTSGAGKSTLAARMLQRGHRILADDVCPIDMEARAVPGLPRLKLWQDAARRLKIGTDGLRRIRPSLDKFDVPLDGMYCDEPLPIRAIYLLRPWNEPRLLSEPVIGLAKYPALRANSYRFRFLKGMGEEPRHLAQCSRLAARVPIARVHRPKSGFDVDGLADLILEDLACRPAS